MEINLLIQTITNGLLFQVQFILSKKYYNIVVIQNIILLHDFTLRIKIIAYLYFDYYSIEILDIDMVFYQ